MVQVKLTVALMENRAPREAVEEPFSITPGKGHVISRHMGFGWFHCPLGKQVRTAEPFNS